jgi:hypothetical protein
MTKSTDRVRSTITPRPVARSMAPVLLVLLMLAILLLATGAHSQHLEPPGSWRQSYTTEHISPDIHKWYGLRHLPETYLRPWYDNSTNYSEQSYSRYIDRSLEGRELYDTLGSPLGRGWVVYNWTQNQPQPRGSSIDKKRGFSGNSSNAGSLGFTAYDSFFQRLVVAGDYGASSSYRLAVGDEIYTRFTPLTFAKPRFNGVVADVANQYLEATLLFSRPSQPDDQDRTNVTHLMGGHLRLQPADRFNFGLTYVNAHNVQTQVEFNQNNPLHGILTTRQNQPLDKLWVRIRDDSPGKGDIGAVLAGHEIVLTDTSGRQLRGRDIGLEPRIEGGIFQRGRLVALDAESILLEYDLKSLDIDDGAEGIQSEDIRAARVELSLANDYRVEVASNLQTDGESFNPEIVFLPILRAEGNVQDNSNTRVVSADYGLPVANELIGTDWNLTDWNGFSSRGEVVLNRRISRYPNPNRLDHHDVVRSSTASYLHLAYDHRPFKIFAEGYSIDDDYSTAFWLNDSDGRISYKNPVPQVVEFVDDDDDFNGRPEWQRPFQPSNERAWPGFDENRDFLNDHNQNNNQIPDYEEPFLRFRSDRPEFLFGLDMNHNGTVDRFENDDLPDYPYKADHRGYNIYAETRPRPGWRLVAGRQSQRLIAGDGRTQANYALLSLKADRPRLGRIRIFAHGVRVKDNIPDDLVQWFQPIDAPGRMRQVFDPLPGRDTWRQTLYADLSQDLGAGLRLQHRAKWDWWHQFASRQQLAQREGRPTSGFVGVVNRAEWSLAVGLGVLEPRFKSEYRRQRPFSTRLPTSTSLEETFSLLWTQPLMAEATGVSYFPRYGRQLFNTELQLGLEASRLWLLDGEREDVNEDYLQWTLVGQISNRTAFQGYQLVTRLGLQLIRRDFAKSEDQRSSLGFLSINAGLR